MLGFLSWRPASGYDLRRSISESIGNFWNESYGQIYPALRDLEREGLAHRTVERAQGKPDRHLYTITEAGRGELRRWLEQPCGPHVYRVEVMIKLFFGEQAPLDASLAHVARYRDEHTALLGRYEAIREHLLRDFGGDPRLSFWLLTVECGARVGRAYLDWCDRAETELRELAQRGSDGVERPALRPGSRPTRAEAGRAGGSPARSAGGRGRKGGR